MVKRALLQQNSCTSESLQSELFNLVHQHPTSVTWVFKRPSTLTPSLLVSQYVLMDEKQS